jgi:L-fuculose-phosphate aldolase
MARLSPDREKRGAVKNPERPDGALAGLPPKSPDEARLQVAAACRILAAHGHEDLTLGHVSVRGPDPRDVYIKGKGKALGEVGPDDVVVVKLDEPDGYRVAGTHLETVMHMETYRARADVGAAIHTHPLFATALGATASSLEYLSHDALLFNDGVGLYDATAGLITTPEEGRAVVDALGQRRAVLLQNHGMLAVGRDIRWATLAALTLERAVRVQVLASFLGKFTPIPEDELDVLSPVKYQEPFLDEYWSAWVRRLESAPEPLW